MTCTSGKDHTVTLSDDGVVHSFGRNNEGQLGHNKTVSFPCTIPNLPEIMQVCCGRNFTVCVDTKGFLWSFGENNKGQLGTGNTTNVNVPQKIQEIPPVHYVSCGFEHSLIITKDSNLWSCGNNDYGQLCLGNKENQLKFQQTFFSNVSNVSLGYLHTLFQINNGEIYSCGYNNFGELGLGCFTESQIKVTPIPKLHLNIIQFFCGYHHNLFLDSKGNVFSVGNNLSGQLGLGHNTNQNTLNQIPNIPPIKSISCVGYSSYLIDFEGNVWSFGNNYYGQLGHGDTTNRKVPQKMPKLKDIRQVSHGSGDHFFAKDSRNKIFVTGYNYYNQLGSENTEQVLISKELDPQYLPIWGGNKNLNQWKRQCLETMNWKEEDMKKLERIQSKIIEVKYDLESSNNNKIKQKSPQNIFETWNEVEFFLNEKLQQTNSKLNQKQNFLLQKQKDVQMYEQELKEIENTIQKLQERKLKIEENLLPSAKRSQSLFEKIFQDIEDNQKQLKQMCPNVSIFCENEKEMNEEICELFSQKQFEDFDSLEISKVLWKMDLIKYQSLFEQNQIDGEFAVMMIDDWKAWKQLGVEKRDCFYLVFYFKMMNTSGYSKTLLPEYEPNCCVCSHASAEKTVLLLKEYGIPIASELILKNNYCTPLFTFSAFNDEFLPDALSSKAEKIMAEILEWKKIHTVHLKNLKRIK